jgi:hypothetical protein
MFPHTHLKMRDYINTVYNTYLEETACATAFSFLFMSPIHEFRSDM